MAEASPGGVGRAGGAGRGDGGGRTESDGDIANERRSGLECRGVITKESGANIRDQQSADEWRNITSTEDSSRQESSAEEKVSAGVGEHSAQNSLSPARQFCDTRGSKRRGERKSQRWR
jgi:hypothetical protein